MAAIGYTLLAVAIFILDLFIKNHIENTRTEGEEEAVLGGRLLIRRYHNKGAFLNAGERRRGLVAVLSVALTLCVTVLFLLTFTCKGSRLLKAGLASDAEVCSGLCKLSGEKQKNQKYCIQHF